MNLKVNFTYNQKQKEYWTKQQDRKVQHRVEQYKSKFYGIE